MSCCYPSCYMGSHSCPYENECDKEALAVIAALNAKKKLDEEEQKARIAYYKANTPKESQ